MGIIANYQYLSDNELSQIVPDSRQEEELFNLVEDSTNENETLIDIDKMWDALLFVMTGFSSSEFMDGDPLREAVLRVTPLEEVSEYIVYTEKNKIAEIVEALESFDMHRALADFSSAEIGRASCRERV